MLPRLLRLAVSQPELLAEHAEAYAALAATEGRDAAQALQRQLLWGALGAGAVGAAVVLAGVAALLWASTPLGQIHAPGLLLAVPLAPAAGALICLRVAQRIGRRAPFATLRDQLHADLAMLRETRPGEPT